MHRPMETAGVIVMRESRKSQMTIRRILISSVKRDALHGSMQHLVKVFFVESRRLISFAGIFTRMRPGAPAFEDGFDFSAGDLGGIVETVALILC